MKRNLQLNWFFCVNSTVQIITPSPKINTPHPHRQCNYHPCDFGIGVEATGNYLVEKKLVQILSSASSREGRFQKLLLTCRTWIDFLEFLSFKDDNIEHWAVFLTKIFKLKECENDWITHQPQKVLEFKQVWEKTIVTWWTVVCAWIW